MEMEPHIKARFTPDVRAQVAAVVGVSVSALEDLGGFESFVFRLPEHRLVVKATWSGRRTEAQLGAELHFVNHLADHGAPVCRALPLADGALIGAVPAEGGVFRITAFAEAPGRVLRREDWTEEILRTWGETVGTLHRLSTAYPGPPPPLARPTWEAEHGAYRHILRDEPDMLACFDALLAEVAALPRTPGTFGAVHTDLHRNNLHWQDGRAMVFDFDDMLDFWFASDLAIVLYYGVLNPIWTDSRQADFERLYPMIMEGYARQHTLPDEAVATIPLFMRLREQVLRAVVLRSIPPDRRPPQQVRYLEAVTARILAGEPALGLRI